MTLLGFTLQQLGILFGAVGAGVTILYILKLRRRRVRVPFAKLWYRVLKEKESTSLFQRLKRLLSLLLQLAFLFLLIAALGDPRLSSEVLDGRRIIMVIDASGSMKATDSEAGTRMAAALSEAREIVRGMNGADTMMIVRMDAQVTPLSPFDDDEKALLKVLDDVEATDTRADLLRALKFCGDSLRGRKNPLLILISDGAYSSELLRSVKLDDGSGPRIVKAAAKPTPKDKSKSKSKSVRKGKGVRVQAAALDIVDLSGIPLRHVQVGRSRDNVGIVAFNARRYIRNKLSFEVFMEVVNYRKKAVELDLQLLANGQVIEVQRLTLKAGERARYTCDPDQKERKKKAWCDIAATGEMLEARLVVPGAGAGKPRALDAFPLDDHAYALLPSRKKQRVLLVSRGNLYLEGALLLEPNLKVTKISPTEYSPALVRKADTVVFDGYFPAEPPGVHSLVINPPNEGGPFKVTGRMSVPLITEQHQTHPVMRHVTLKDTNISNSAKFSREPGTHVLAASLKTPVMVARVDGGIKTVSFGFDVKRSDLPLRVAFPILILNSLDWFAGDSAGLITSYSTGETWSVPWTGRDAKKVEKVSVTGPDGQRTFAPVHDGRVILYGSHVGLYRLRRGDHRLSLAANLADPVESRIQGAAPLVIDGRKLAAPSGFGIALRREIWIYLLLAAVGLSLLEWLSYNRRITV